MSGGRFEVGSRSADQPASPAGIDAIAGAPPHCIHGSAPLIGSEGTETHEVRVDRARTLVTVRVHGFLVPEQVPTLVSDVRQAVRSLGSDVGRHVTLYDVSDAHISPGATIVVLREAFRDPEMRPLWARKVAFVAPSALARMQIQRLRDVRHDIAVFDERGRALSWLLAK